MKEPIGMEKFTLRVTEKGAERKCAKCGEWTPIEGKYCMHCGKAFEED